MRRRMLLLAGATIGSATILYAGLYAGPVAAAGGPDDFTACVREHGLPDFPGVTLDDGGRPQLNGSVDVFSDAYRKAAAACDGLLGAGTPPGAPTPPAPSPPAGTKLPALDPPAPPAAPR